jgi:NADPH:quinone reductase-like Zn-dependent oxidoreductase
MQAVVIREFGGPEVMRLEDVPVPVPSAGEVLLKVEAVSVNRTLDLAVRAGRYPRPVQLPHVLGADPSGIIVALGEGVTSRKMGDRVTTSPSVKAGTATQPPVMLGVGVWGGYAQYLTLPAANTHPIPDGMDFSTATIVGRHAPLAFNQLKEKARLKPDEWVLIMGAAGGLGSASIQVAKYLGASVIAAAGADERVEAAKTLGADYGVNYRSSDLTMEVRRLTEGRGVDVVVENVGDADLFPKAFASLARNGRLVTAGAHAGGIVPLDLNQLYLNYITIMGSTVHTDADIALSLEVAAQGHLDVLIDKEMPLADAAAAHKLIAGRSGVGKVVLKPW